MEKWKQHVLAGNAFFDAQQNQQATAEYQAAKERAEKLLAVWLDEHEAVAAVVISYHNLANLYVRQGETAKAEAELRHVLRLIQHTLSDPRCSPARREALMSGERRAHVELLNHIRTHGAASEEPLSPPLTTSLSSS